MSDPIDREPDVAAARRKLAKSLTSVASTTPLIWAFDAVAHVTPTPRWARVIIRGSAILHTACTIFGVAVIMIATVVEHVGKDGVR